MRPGPLNALTDVPGLRVGHAAADGRLSGTTVVLADRAVPAAASVAGGAPGTRGVSVLDGDRVETAGDAIALSGGSAFGLDAAGGAMDALRRRGRGFAVGPARVPIVPGAIVFDLLTGPNADDPAGWDAPPWFALGRAAAEAAAAAPEHAAFALGNAGAGLGARAGPIKGGIGTASLVWERGGRRAVVGALAVANPLGSVTVPGSRAFWARPFEREAEFGAVPAPSEPLAADALDHDFEALTAGANTTLAVVAISLALDRGACARVAAMAHDGFARAIRPVHSPLDGDTVFVLATGAAPVTDPVADTARAGLMAADCVARAIARAVYEAEAVPGVPAWRDLDDRGRAPG
ncbi:MAG: P1 family peptidase [Paracoccaceae bacterium]